MVVKSVQNHIAGTFLIAACLLAEIGVAAPSDPVVWRQAWLDKVRREGVPNGAAFAGRVVVANTKGGDAGGGKLDIAATTPGRKLGFLEAANPRDVLWSALLNPGVALNGATVARLASADLVLVMDAGSKTKLRLLHVDDDGKESELGKETLSDDTDLRQFLKKALGYDAVVLDQEGDLVLAQTPEFGAGEAPDALALAASAGASKIALPQAATGIALLRLIATKDGTTIFRVLSSKTAAPLPFATKLILESTKKL